MKSIIVLLIAIASSPWLFRKALLIGFRAPKITTKTTPAASGLPFSTIRIPTRNDRTLHAWFLPNKPDAACIIIMHGWGGNGELMLPVAKPFFVAGLNVLLPDARGHGSSDDDSFSSLPRFAEDIEASIDWLYNRPQLWNKKLIVLGHSVGAGAALFAASRDPRVNGVISLSAFSHPANMMQRYLGKFPTFARHLIIGLVQSTIGHKLDDIAPVNTIRKIHCPILVAHGLADSTVPADEARDIVANAGENHPELLLIDGADHDSVEIFHDHADELVEFLKRENLIFPEERQTRQKQ